MPKVVYIGAGLDIIPFLVLNDIDEFIYIDGLPQSEFGMIEYESGYFYRNYFLDNLYKLMQNNKIDLVYKSDNYLEFSKNNRKIKYFINTPFPEKLSDDIINELYDAENLILSGYFPHKVILDLMPKLHTIYGNMHTVYTFDKTDEEEQDNVIGVLLNMPNLNYYMIKETINYDYWIIENINESIYNIYTVAKCKSIQEMEIIRKN
jgi:hypothetical protein